MVRIFGVFALFLITMGLPGASTAASEQLTVRDAWVRAPVMTGRPAAGYFIIENPEAVDHILVGAKSSQAERIELHTHIMENDRMMMRPIDRVTVPAGGSVAFESHGHHLMIFGLEAVTPGDTIAITLEFANRPAITVAAEVVGTGTGAPHNNH